jgi:subtilisin family serine protease
LAIAALVGALVVPPAVTATAGAAETPFLPLPDASSNALLKPSSSGMPDVLQRSEKLEPATELGESSGRVPGEAVGVLIQFDQSPPPETTIGETQVSETVQESIDADPALGQSVPDVTSADSLGDGLFSVELDAKITAAQALEIVDALKQSVPDAAVEPDWVLQLDPSETESLRVNASQSNPPWGLDRIDQLRLPLNNRYSDLSARGAGVRVYVVDSGVRASHVDFGGRVVAGYDGIGDGRGSGDCNGHGTHVAGTIAGTQSGVAKQATIVPVRVFPCSGGTTTGVTIAGLNWILTDPGRNARPAVVNMSLGGPFSSLLNSKVRQLVDSGIPVVVASGNGGDNGIGDDACGQSPASESSAITVNASDGDDLDAVFSNWGRCTDIYAPGVDIRSAGITSNTSFTDNSGTSMAAPHVAGAVALLLSEGLSTHADFEGILASKNPDALFSGLPGDPTSLLYTALPTNPSSAPQNLVVTPNGRSLDVRWSAPANLNGGVVSDYVIRQRVGAGSWVTVDDGGGTGRTASVTGLLAGTTYQIAVSALTQHGESAPVIGSGVPLSGVTSTPQNLVVTPSGRSLDLSWAAPATLNGGVVSDYLIEYRVGAGTWEMVEDGVGFGTSASVTGLLEETTYEVSVSAVTDHGASERVFGFGTPLPPDPPSAPQNLVVTPGGRSLDVRWAAPATLNGGVVSDYVVQYRVGAGAWETVDDGIGFGTSVLVTGLLAGTIYEVAVSAVTEYGSSATAFAPGVPLSGVTTAPRSLVAVDATATSASMSWAVPATLNGGVVTDYRVQYRVGSTGSWLTFADAVSTRTSVTVTGLPTRGVHQVRVAAVTAFGVSAYGPAVSTLRTFIAPTPRITGTLKVANTLTATAGTWDPAAIALTYRWHRNGAAISGATSRTYTLSGLDAGALLTVKVTGTRAGFATVTKTSGSTARIAPGVLTSAPTPTVSGLANVGSRLTVAAGRWGPGAVTLSYQWNRNGSAIAGATASTYVLAPSDAGRTVTVRVTGRQTGYTSASKLSRSTATVTVPIRISGDGIRLVPSEVPRTTYVTTSKTLSDLCYWKTLSGFSNGSRDIVNNNLGNGQMIMEVTSLAVGVSTVDCGSWVRLADIPTARKSSVPGDGVWSVQKQIVPGLYRASGGADLCYWKRASDFTDDGRAIIDNYIGSSPRPIMRIFPGDVAFESSRCGSWTRISD